MGTIGDTLAIRREYREWKKERRAGPEARIRHRQQIKQDIRDNLRWPETDPAPEAIIRDTARMDDYPKVDDSWQGISPWFKVEVKGLYHRGLEVIIKFTSVELSRKDAREVSNGTATVAVVGRIPFDSIVAIDWDGDEYYPMPHVYCWFEWPEGPYESLEVYRRPNDRGYWEHLDRRFRPLKYSRFQRWRSHRALNRAQKEFDRLSESDDGAAQ